MFSFHYCPSNLKFSDFKSLDDTEKWLAEAKGPVGLSVRLELSAHGHLQHSLLLSIFLQLHLRGLPCHFGHLSLWAAQDSPSTWRPALLLYLQKDLGSGPGCTRTKVSEMSIVAVFQPFRFCCSPGPESSEMEWLLLTSCFAVPLSALHVVSWEILPFTCLICYSTVAQMHYLVLLIFSFSLSFCLVAQ